MQKTDRQQTNSQTIRHTDKQMGRQTDRPTVRKSDKQADIVLRNRDRNNDILLVVILGCKRTTLGYRKNEGERMGARANERINFQEVAN